MSTKFIVFCGANFVGGNCAPQRQPAASNSSLFPIELKPKAARFRSWFAVPPLLFFPLHIVTFFFLPKDPPILSVVVVVVVAAAAVLSWSSPVSYTQQHRRRGIQGTKQRETHRGQNAAFFPQTPPKYLPIPIYPDKPTQWHRQEARFRRLERPVSFGSVPDTRPVLLAASPSSFSALPTVIPASLQRDRIATNHSRAICRNPAPSSPLAVGGPGRAGRAAMKMEVDDGERQKLTRCATSRENRLPFQ